MRKFVISPPVVTGASPATLSVEHKQDNRRDLCEPLPDVTTRTRMGIALGRYSGIILSKRHVAARKSATE